MKLNLFREVGDFMLFLYRHLDITEIYQFFIAQSRPNNTYIRWSFRKINIYKNFPNSQMYTSKWTVSVFLFFLKIESTILRKVL